MPTSCGSSEPSRDTRYPPPVACQPTGRRASEPPLARGEEARRTRHGGGVDHRERRHRPRRALRTPSRNSAAGPSDIDPTNAWTATSSSSRPTIMLSVIAPGSASLKIASHGCPPRRYISTDRCRRLYATLNPWVLRAREPPWRASIPTKRTFPRALRGTVSVQRATELSHVMRTARVRLPPTQTRQWIEPRLPPNSTRARSSNCVPACGGRGEAERNRIEIDESAPPPAKAAGTSTAAAVATASAASRPAAMRRG
jgi:hypothetical protein